MSISNYNELKTEVAAWLHRSDLTPKVIDFISLAESKFNTEFRVLNMVNEANVSVTSGSDNATLPTGFLELIYFRDDDDCELEQVSHPTLYEYKSGSSSKPNKFAISSQIDFHDNSDGNYTYVMSFYKKLDIASDSTNWLLTNSPNVYLFTALAMAGLYTRDEDLMKFFELSNAAIADVKKSDGKNKHKPLLRTGLSSGGRSNIMTDV